MYFKSSCASFIVAYTREIPVLYPATSISTITYHMPHTYIMYAHCTPTHRHRHTCLPDMSYLFSLSYF